MFQAYRTVFAQRGAIPLCAAGLLSRSAVAIYPIGLVLLLSLSTGRYGFAALVSGGWTLGNALAHPVAGTLIDRFGPRRVLPWFLVGHTLSAAAFTALVAAGNRGWVLLGASVVLGGSVVNTGAVVRAHWARQWADGTRERSAAISLESMLDEVAFAAGPLLATALALHASPIWVIGSALLVSVVGTVWLLRYRLAVSPAAAPGPGGHRRTVAVRRRGMPPLCAALLMAGVTCGSAEVLMVALSARFGATGSAGWAVAGFSVGSCLAALAHGALRWRSPAPIRFAFAGVAFGLLPLLYFTASSPAVLVLCAVANGLGMGPTVVNGFDLVNEFVPAGSLTEGMTWVWTSLSVGYGIGSGVVGVLADAVGARAGFTLPSACGLAVTVFGGVLGVRARKTGRDRRVAPAAG